MIPDRHEWDQIYKLLLKANEYENFIRDIATLNAPIESWQEQAAKILRKP